MPNPILGPRGRYGRKKTARLMTSPASLTLYSRFAWPQIGRRSEYLGIADRKGLALANSQRPPGSYAERPWDELPECSGSIHHLRN
jgi:hypothetical protein